MRPTHFSDSLNSEYIYVSREAKMLSKYFKKIPKTPSQPTPPPPPGIALPDPSNRSTPEAAARCAAANAAIVEVHNAEEEQAPKKRKRGEYSNYDEDVR